MTQYTLTDSNSIESYATLAEVASRAEDWYDYLLDSGDVSEDLRDAVYSADFGDCETIEDLQSAIDDWRNHIADALGVQSFTGHGTYFVSPADRAGITLTCRVEGIDKGRSP